MASKIWTSTQCYIITNIKKPTKGKFVGHLNVGDILKFYIPIYTRGVGRTSRGSVRAAEIKVTCVNTGDFNYYTGNGITKIFESFELQGIGNGG